MKPATLQADSICHVLDESARSILLDALIKEEQWIREEIKLCTRVNAEFDIPGLKARLDRVRGLYDMIDASWVTCEHNGNCNAPTGCNFRGRNRDEAGMACGAVELAR